MFPCINPTRSQFEDRPAHQASPRDVRLPISGGLCFFHANPDSTKALGQIDGQKNRRSVVDLQVPDNMTAADVHNV